MDYPGDKADPKDVARWMSAVAEEEYGLPGILPVMTSCVELTDAWTSPGDVTKVEGYLWPVDGCSVGYFQQQADYLGCGYFGWGSIEHLIQADYSLRRFCEEAVKYKKWGWNQNSADDLGKWCQVVQNSDYALVYRDKGYPMAVELLDQTKDDPVDYEERVLGVDEAGWVFDKETNLYIRFPDHRSRPLDADNTGWVYTTPTVAEQVKKLGGLRDPGSGWYVEQHPTNYNWRADIKELVDYVEENFDTYANTYYDHPPGYGRDDTSVDFWHPDGRGVKIDYSVGQAIFDYIFNNPNPPWIDWVIWQGWIWDRYNGWRKFWEYDEASDGQHMNHVHITFV